MHEPDAARERIRAMVREIEELASKGGPPEQFFPAFLQRLVVILGAEAGGIWLRDATGRVAQMCEMGLANTGVMASQASRQLNDKLLEETLRDGVAQVLAPDSPGTQVPTPHVLLLAPLNMGRENVVGAVEVFQRANSAVDARPGYLQFMEQMCGHASRFLQHQQAALEQLSPEEFWKQFEQFTLRLQRTLDINELTNTAANDGRQLIACDRVSVAVFRFNKTTIAAISGTDSVNRRANLVRAMTKLVSRVISGREPLLYTGQIEHFPPQIEVPLADFVSESNSRMVYIQPLFAPPPLIPNKVADEAGATPPKRKVIGALIVEQVAEGKPRAGLEDRVKLTAEHVAASLNSAIVHQQLFLLPLWRFLGRMTERIRGRFIWKALAVLCLIGAIAGTLMYFPWEYRVEARGKLMPGGQSQVFAPWEATVQEIAIKSGEQVKQGQLLIRLRSDELTQKLIASTNQLSELSERLSALQADLDAAQRQAQQDKVTETQGHIQEAVIQIRGVREQVTALQTQIDQLDVKAPISGVVTTFQIDQLLANRPVTRGEVLLEVMQEEGPWRLELEIPDNRMGHVRRRQKELKTPQLPVEFMLATSTDLTYVGSLDTSSSRTALTEGTGSVVEAYADIAETDFQRLQNGGLRVGAEVTAWVGCGPKPLGYVLFGDVIEFIQKRSIFW